MDRKNLQYLKKRKVKLKKFGRMDKAKKNYKQAVKIDNDIEQVDQK
jgi:hypothetical protein